MLTDLLLSITNLLLSPICLLLFLIGTLGKGERFFTRIETNVYRLNFIPYLLYCAGYLVVLFSGALIYSWINHTDIALLQFFQPSNYTISIIGWCVTGATLMVYAKGMEGNIMGFIFFPLLILSTAALGISQLFALVQPSRMTVLLAIWGIVAWMVFSRCMKMENKIVGFVFFFFFIALSIAAATVDKATYAALDFPLLPNYFSLTFLLHAFTPFYLLLLLHDKEGEALKEDKPGVNLLASLFMQGLFFGINWIIIGLFGQEPLTFRAFFGEGQTVFYYLPMLAGGLYWLLFWLDKSWKKQPSVVLQAFLYVAVGSILIEGFCYVQLMASYF